MNADTSYTVNLIQKGLTLLPRKSPLQRYRLLRKGKDVLA